MNKIWFDTIKSIVTVAGFEALLKEHVRDGSLIVQGVPDAWIDAFRTHGFSEYAAYLDCWIDELSPPGVQYCDYDFLLLDESIAAAEVSASCRGYSRGFEGESPDWFASWLRGEDDGFHNHAVLVHRTAGCITGISCTATYAHDSDKGIVVFFRMLAVHPEHQGHGIGRKLLMQTLQYGADCGARRAFLHVDTRNAQAIKLYTDAGFLPRKDEVQIDMKWEDEV